MCLSANSYYIQYHKSGIGHKYYYHYHNRWSLHVEITCSTICGRSSPLSNPCLRCVSCSMRRHQMETFSTLLAHCASNSPVTGDFPTQRQVTRSSDVFFDLRPNKRLSKQWRGWWFETPSRPLRRHCNGNWWLVPSVEYQQYSYLFISEWYHCPDPWTVLHMFRTTISHRSSVCYQRS